MTEVEQEVNRLLFESKGEDVAGLGEAVLLMSGYKECRANESQSKEDV